MRQLRCDFCSQPDPTWLCPCVPYSDGLRDAQGRVHWSGPDWLACEACAELICQGRRDELWQRGMVAVARALRKSGHSVPPQLAAIVRGMHDGFWSHREGPPRRLSEREILTKREEPDREERDVEGPPPPAARWVREAGLA